LKQQPKRREIPITTFLNNLLLTIFLAGTIGMALKFITYFDHWVYFPSFPNVLDSTFLILSVIYIAAYIIHKNRRRNQGG